MERVQLTQIDGPATRDQFEEIQRVYAEVFPGYDLDDHRRRTTSQLQVPGFTTITARIAGQLVGFAYGLPLRPSTGWWDGLQPPPGNGFTTETGSRTFAVIDLAVASAQRGHGLGRRLMEELLRNRVEERSTLATNPSHHEVQAMYERWGWHKVGQVPGGEGETQSRFDLYVIALGADDAASSSR